MNLDAALMLADGHLSAHDFGGNRPTLLLYLRQRLAAAGQTSAKADAVQAWIDGIIFTAALSPEQLAAALTPPPFAFAEVVVECAQTLSQS